MKLKIKNIQNKHDNFIGESALIHYLKTSVFSNVLKHYDINFSKYIILIQTNTASDISKHPTSLTLFDKNNELIRFEMNIRRIAQLKIATQLNEFWGYFEYLKITHNIDSKNDEIFLEFIGYNKQNITEYIYNIMINFDKISWHKTNINYIDFSTLYEKALTA